MTVRERMAIYQQSKQLTDYAIEKALNKSKGYWHTCKNPTAGIITLFAKIFPDISMEWLIRGEGEMLRNIPEQKTVTMSPDLTDEYLKRLIDERIARAMSYTEKKKEA